MKMTIPYNITGKQRKQLAEDISAALHTIPKYLGYPACNYPIGDCILERDGKLIIPDCVADETATALLEHLRSRGYVGEAVESEDRLTISMPTLPLLLNFATCLGGRSERLPWFMYIRPQHIRIIKALVLSAQHMTS